METQMMVAEMGLKYWRYDVRDGTFNRLVKLLLGSGLRACLHASRVDCTGPFRQQELKGSKGRQGSAAGKGEGTQPLAAAAMATVSRALVFLCGI